MGGKTKRPKKPNFLKKSTAKALSDSALVKRNKQVVVVQLYEVPKIIGQRCGVSWVSSHPKGLRRSGVFFVFEVKRASLLGKIWNYFGKSFLVVYLSLGSHWMRFFSGFSFMF